jgi:hypothetical protein
MIKELLRGLAWGKGEFSVVKQDRDAKVAKLRKLRAMCLRFLMEELKPWAGSLEMGARTMRGFPAGGRRSS